MSDFNEACYRLLRDIPEGRVTTYKSIARALGSKAYRAVGNAMRQNPYIPEVPCHRVICTDGTLGGYAYGLPEKIKLLEKEGVRVANGKVVNFESVMFECK